MRLSALCLKDFPLNIGGKSIGLACTDKKLSFLIIMASMIPLSTLNVFPCFKLLITAWEVYIINTRLYGLYYKNRLTVEFTSTFMYRYPIFFVLIFFYVTDKK